MTDAVTEAALEPLAALKSCDLFAGVGENALRHLAAHAQIVAFSARESIFRENDLAEHVFFIIDGVVDLVICRKDVGCRQLMQLGAGELLGWSPLVQRPRLSASAIAGERTTAIKIEAAPLNKLQERNPECFGHFMSQLARIVAQRLNATRLQMLDVCGVRLPEFPIETD